MANPASSPSLFTTKAEKRESEEKEKRQAAVAKRIENFSSSLEDLQISFSTKCAVHINKAYGTLRIKVLLSIACHIFLVISLAFARQVVRGREFPILELARGTSLIGISLGNVDQTKLTSSKMSCLSPTWNESFVFRIDGSVPKSLTLRHHFMSAEEEVQMKGGDHRHGELKGVADIPINIDALRAADRPISIWSKLRAVDSSRPHQRASKQCGEVQVELKWMLPIEAAEAQDVDNSKATLPTLVRSASASDATLQPGNDAKRMILVGQLSRLRSNSSELRRAAIQSLVGRAGRNGTNLPKTGDWLRTLITSFSERITKDSDAEVRVEALHGLVMISQVDNPAVIRVVAASMRDPSRDVRHAAVGAILQLARSGDETAITAVAERLEDGNHCCMQKKFAGSSKIA